jgi:DNA repair photolyase
MCEISKTEFHIRTERTMNTIYVPKGKAREYGDYALNIYKGCPHECFYCFAPNVLHREKEKFHACVEPRENVVKETKKYLDTHNIKNKTIHLCFTCDPYPFGYDTTPTREIIKIIKESGNNVQILTKGDGSRDFDLLDEWDWYGITLDGMDCKAPLKERAGALFEANRRGFKTWVSFEPVTDEEKFFHDLQTVSGIVDKVKIGKLNYHHSDIDWKSFGEKAEKMCKELKIDYYIKESLRREMGK